MISRRSSFAVGNTDEAQGLPSFLGVVAAAREPAIPKAFGDPPSWPVREANGDRATAFCFLSGNELASEGSWSKSECFLKSTALCGRSEGLSSGPSSSSILNMRSACVPFGRRSGLKGSFLFGPFLFPPCMGEIEAKSSRLPNLPLTDEENFLSSSFRLVLNAISLTLRCLSSSISWASSGYFSCRSSSARPLRANGL